MKCTPDALRAAAPLDPPGRYLCVGTHHKTGTVWMRRTLHQIKRRQGLPLNQVNRPQKLARLGPEAPQLLVNWDTTFPAELRAMPEARFLHVIRDPRDVLLSGMRYHRIAPVGNEKFLSRTHPDWGGLTYQEKLNSLTNDVDALLFEMRAKHATTVGQMLDWDYDMPNSVELRYEDLIADTDCTLFRAALTRLNVAGLEIDGAVQAFWDYSRFGQDKGAQEQAYLSRLHHGSGAAAQWTTRLPRGVAEVYARDYGEALIALGYATDTDWVQSCPPAASLAA